MKKNAWILAALFMAFSFTAFGQNSLPATVKTAFSKKFPTVKNAKWAQEGKTQWEAEFKLNAKSMSANFDYQGNWKETETELSKSSLSKKLMETLSNKFPGYAVKGVAFSQTPKQSVYEVVIEKGESKLEVSLDKNGKIVGQEKAGDEND